MNTSKKLIAAVLRKQISSRGGGIEIDLTPYGFTGQKMAAYQNYLGGGVLGSIQVNDTIRRQTIGCDDPKINTKLDKIGKELMAYYHSLACPDTDFETVQGMPASAY